MLDDLFWLVPLWVKLMVSFSPASKWNWFRFRLWSLVQPGVLFFALSLLFFYFIVFAMAH